MSIGERALRAALSHFEAESRRHRANLTVYLENPAGVGEHPDIVAEVIKITQLITESEDNIRTLEDMVENYESCGKIPSAFESNND